MDVRDKVTQWVEFKIGKLLMKEIKEKDLIESSHIDLDEYSQMLFEKYFSHEDDIKELESEMWNDALRLNFESDGFYFSDELSQDSSSNDEFVFRQPSIERIIFDLQSTSAEAQLTALEALEASSAEELVAQPSWPKIRRLLQNLTRTPSFRKVPIKVLELFRRFLLLNDIPKVVCEGFVGLSESTAAHIEAFNLRKQKLTPERRKQPAEVFQQQSAKVHDAPEIIIVFRSMWLLIESHRSMPFKWCRFNEKRLREIIYSFVRLLSSNKTSKDGVRISALDILSVLDPKATWCTIWCHGATGRSLLCSALKLYRTLFSEIADFAMAAIKAKNCKLSRSKILCSDNLKFPHLNETKKKGEKRDDEFCRINRSSGSSETHSAPSFSADPAVPRCGKTVKSASVEKRRDWIIGGISSEVAKEAKLCHCLSLVVYLIRYRGGRSLFPLELTSRRRRLQIAETVSIVTNHLEELLGSPQINPITTDEYKQHMLKLLSILKSI